MLLCNFDLHGLILSELKQSVEENATGLITLNNFSVLSHYLKINSPSSQAQAQAQEKHSFVDAVGVGLLELHFDLKTKSTKRRRWSRLFKTIDILKSSIYFKSKNNYFCLYFNFVLRKICEKNNLIKNNKLHMPTRQKMYPYQLLIKRKHLKPVSSG